MSRTVLVCLLLDVAVRHVRVQKKFERCKFEAILVYIGETFFVMSRTNVQHGLYIIFK